MEVVVTTGTIRRAKLLWNRHHQQTNTQHITGRMPFLSPNQHCRSTEGKIRAGELTEWSPEWELCSSTARTGPGNWRSPSPGRRAPESASESRWPSLPSPASARYEDGVTDTTYCHFGHDNRFTYSKLIILHPPRHFPSSALAWRHASSNCVIHKIFVVPAKWYCHFGLVNRFTCLLTYLLTYLLSGVKQWRRSVVKYGAGGVGYSQVKPSNCFRCLENLVLPSHFDTSLSSSTMWNLQLLSNNSFEWRILTF